MQNKQKWQNSSKIQKSLLKILALPAHLSTYILNRINPHSDAPCFVSLNNKQLVSVYVLNSKQTEVFKMCRNCTICWVAAWSLVKCWKQWKKLRKLAKVAYKNSKSVCKIFERYNHKQKQVTRDARKPIAVPVRR